MSVARRFVPAAMCLLIAGWLLLARGDENRVRRAAQLGAAGQFRAAAAEAGGGRRRPPPPPAAGLRGRAPSGAPGLAPPAAGHAPPPRPGPPRRGPPRGKTRRPP